MDLNDLINSLDQADDKPPKTSILENVEKAAEIETANLVASPPSNSGSESVDMHKYLRRLDDVTEDVLSACKSDRAEAQDLINILKEQVTISVTSGTKLSTGIVESLVKAIEVKSNINTTAVKMIEANAKTLAATKSSINIQQNAITTAGFDSSALERLLSEPMTEMDEI